MEQDIKKILLHESTILSRLDQLAHQIAEDFQDKQNITVISILNGSFVFMADLLRRIRLPLQIDCWSVSSYHGTKSKGEINFRQHEVANVTDRHVLLLDDILDSGLTLATIKERLLYEKSAKTVSCCVLLEKTFRELLTSKQITLASTLRTNLLLVMALTITKIIGTFHILVY